MIMPASEEAILKAAEALLEGKIIAFPTETVYGLGVDAANEQAVASLFRLKNRPAANPLIVHVCSTDQIGTVADLSTDARATARLLRISALWPGPLSVILPKGPLIASETCGGHETVAVRIPRHAVALKLLEKAGLPIAAPSANLFAHISPTSAQHVEETFKNKIELILDGGPCQVGLESTIISLVTDQPQILRPGAISRAELAIALDEPLAADLKPLPDSQTEEIITAPGMFRKHYAPKTPIAFIEDLNPDQLPKKMGRISFSEVKEEAFSYSEVIQLSKNGSLEEIARNLFAALHSLDKHELDLIVIDRCVEVGLGVAIMDRIKRASA